MAEFSSLQLQGCDLAHCWLLAGELSAPRGCALFLVMWTTPVWPLLHETSTQDVLDKHSTDPSSPWQSSME